MVKSQLQQHKNRNRMYQYKKGWQMTIYFDINEQPYNTPVEGYIASCTDSQWAYYSQSENRDKYKLDRTTKQLV